MSEIYSDLLEHLELDEYTLASDTIIIDAAEECRCDLCGLAL